MTEYVSPRQRHMHGARQQTALCVWFRLSLDACYPAPRMQDSTTAGGTGYRERGMVRGREEGRPVVPPERTARSGRYEKEQVDKNRRKQSLKGKPWKDCGNVGTRVEYVKEKMPN